MFEELEEMLFEKYSALMKKSCENFDAHIEEMIKTNQDYTSPKYEE